LLFLVARSAAGRKAKRANVGRAEGESNRRVKVRLVLLAKCSRGR
jgi:hypothetical protein